MTTPENTKISAFEVVGSPFCVALSDGQTICDHLTAALKADRGIALSFRNVTTLTAAFLNAAIGQLYGIFSEEQIRSRLKVVDVEPGRSCVVEPRRRHRPNCTSKIRRDSIKSFKKQWKTKYKRVAMCGDNLRDDTMMAVSTVMVLL